MAISINQINTGTALQINNDIFLVTEHQHVKPGKGGAFMRVKLKNIKTQQVLDKTFRPGDKLDEAPVEERKLQNLYQTDNTFHFMDLESYEEISVPSNIIGDDVRFLQENLEVVGIFANNQVLKINLPIFIIAEITHTEPGLKGDSTKAGTKPATIDTGATMQVPLFIDVGDKIKIDTRTGLYVERVK